MRFYRLASSVLFAFCEGYERPQPEAIPFDAPSNSGRAVLVYPRLVSVERHMLSSTPPDHATPRCAQRTGIVEKISGRGAR